MRGWAGGGGAIYTCRRGAGCRDIISLARSGQGVGGEREVLLCVCVCVCPSGGGERDLYSFNMNCIQRGQREASLIVS